ELDDVDLFAAQLADNRLHTHPLHADAGADTVHIAIPAGDSNLCALAGFPRAPAEGPRAVVNPRYFLFEQTLDQLGISARNNYARAFRGLVHDFDHAADAIA